MPRKKTGCCHPPRLPPGSLLKHSRVGGGKEKDASRAWRCLRRLPTAGESGRSAERSPSRRFLGVRAAVLVPVPVPVPVPGCTVLPELRGAGGAAALVRCRTSVFSCSLMRENKFTWCRTPPFPPLALKQRQFCASLDNLRSRLSREARELPAFL